MLSSKHRKKDETETNNYILQKQKNRNDDTAVVTVAVASAGDALCQSKQWKEESKNNYCNKT